jgi:lipid A disaccharide synthetase
MTAFLHQQIAFTGITEVIHHLPDVQVEREDLIRQIVEE